MNETNTLERKHSRMNMILIALVVGIVIGSVFKALKLPVPVPKDFAGIVGVIGMFVGSVLVDVAAKLHVK